MRIIYNKYLPPKGFKAINLFGLILARKDCGNLNSIEKNHEAIHTVQAREFLFLFFYFAYIIEWIIRLIQYKNTYTAYRNISFEREAYSNQEDLSYLNNRKIFAFFSYYKEKIRRY